MALLLLVGAIHAGAASEAPAGEPDPATRLRAVLLGGNGQRILCPGCPAEPALRFDPDTGQATEVPLPYERVNALAPFPGGDRLLAATSSEKGKRSQLLVLSAASLAPLGRVEIPGNGERLAVSPDGYTAYVISHRPGKGDEADPSEGNWDLLAVDLGKSQVASTYRLPSAGYDVTLSADGSRAFVGLDGKIQSFTTSPLTASWFFRSPGRNFRIQVRPRQGHIYSLRDARVAIFPKEPRKPAEGEQAAREDDASRVLEPPSHVDRFGFSPDGRFAVAAGRGLDVLVIIDATKGKIAGLWPEEDVQVRTLLAQVDAAEKPKGPRGKLVAQDKGYAPPLGGSGPQEEPLRPVAEGGQPSDGVSASKTSPTSASGQTRPSQPGLVSDPSAAPATAKSGMLPGDTPGGPAPPVPAGDSKSPPAPARDEIKASAPGMRASDGSTAQITDKPVVVPREVTRPRAVSPEEAALEEVEAAQLKGQIAGDLSAVAWVVLYGPDSITKEKGRVAPAPDGSFSFDLPPRGKYRILLAAKPGFTLVTRPVFQTLDVGEYGYSGVDFNVIRSVAVSR
ncbi:MAG TPA: hypothetical protein VFW45_05615 [Candidatus Polarisedimenticolia bacterium]|nr:hypothetical protein [Candidatus Polarisedimenticolia bacterium]